MLVNLSKNITEFEEVCSQDVYQMCTACLCATRTTRTLDDDALKQYYMHILTEMQPEGGVAVLQSPRVCWECVSHLKRSVRFREQVRQTHKLLLSADSTSPTEDLDVFLPCKLARPGRLMTGVCYSIDIPPGHYADDGGEDESGSAQQPTVKMEDASDTEAAETDTHTTDTDTEGDTRAHQHDAVGAARMVTAASDDDGDGEIEQKPNVEMDESCDTEAAETNTTDGDTGTHRLHSEQQLQPTDRKTFHCTLCTATFKRKPDLQRHKLTHTGEKPFQCEHCLRTFPRKDHLSRHMTVHANVMKYAFQCDVCSKSFMSNYHLSRHLIVHTDEKPFRCEVCDRRFKGNLGLKLHAKLHTNNVFQCDVCMKIFSNAANMRGHIRRMHSEEKPYQCEVCAKLFIRECELHGHLRTHTGEKPFQCELCDTSFRRKFHLREHMRSHTGEKPFKCKVCSRLFSRKSHLSQHLKTHTGEKPFQCKVCLKSFAMKYNLASHMRTHTGEKLFKCEVCHQLFSLKRYMVKHLVNCRETQPHPAQ